MNRPGPTWAYRGASALLLSGLVLLTATRCTPRDIRLLAGDALADGGAAAAVDSRAASDHHEADGAAVGEDGDDPAELACTGLGDPMRLPTASGSTCAATLAARSHAYVLCSCGALNVGARVRADSFDSVGGSVSQATAALGVNGALQTTAEVRMGGAIHVAGASGIRAADHLQAGATLRSAGALAMLSSNADVSGDAFVGGALSGSVRVSGVLHVPAGVSTGTDVQAQSLVREPVTVMSPCPCDSAFVDLDTAIERAGSQNRNDAVGLGPDGSLAPTSATTVDLPCGTFAVSTIDAAAPLTLAVHGRAVLVVTGDVSLRAGLGVTLDPGAELDLIVGGRLSSSGGHVVGIPASASRFRIWVAGSQSVVFDGAPSIGALIYAPRAAAVASQGFELWGGMLVGALTLGAEVSLHFDHAALGAGTACADPPVPAVE